MSTAVLTKRIAEASPGFIARMAGACEILEGLTSTFGQVIVVNKLVVHADAAATAANILAHETLFRLGFASALIGVAFHIAWTLLFYELFKPVNRSLSLLAAFVGLVGCSLLAFASLFYIAPLAVLGHSQYLGAFTLAHQQALALIFLNLNGQAFNIFLVFFGLRMLMTGYLIFRSTFLPRIFGVLLAIDGLGWMLYLDPPLANHLFMFIAIASALAEIPLPWWLLIRGVHVERWKEQAGEAGVI